MRLNWLMEASMTVTKIPLDEELSKLVEQAIRLGGHNNANEAAAEALREYLQTACEEIAKCLALHERVEECCVVPHGGGVRAIIKLKGMQPQANTAASNTGLQRELVEHCGRHLPHFAPPDVFAFTDDNLPRSGDGKIDCEAVRRQNARD